MYICGTRTHAVICIHLPSVRDKGPPLHWVYVYNTYIHIHIFVKEKNLYSCLFIVAVVFFSFFFLIKPLSSYCRIVVESAARPATDAVARELNARAKLIFRSPVFFKKKFYFFFFYYNTNAPCGPLSDIKRNSRNCYGVHSFPPTTGAGLR